MTVRGGERLRARLKQIQRQARATGKVRGEVGFYGRVASVARAHEFGQRDRAGVVKVPQRPAFRAGLLEARREWTAALEKDARSKGFVTMESIKTAATVAKSAIRASYLDAPGPPVGEA